MNVKQFKDLDGCLSYIISSEKQCALIDVSTNEAQYLEYIKEFSLSSVIIVDTHIHADHLSGTGILSKELNIPVVMNEYNPKQLKLATLEAPENIQNLLKQNGSIKVDQYVCNNESIQVGDLDLRFIHTPGHTLDSMSILIDNLLFSGDSLHIGGIARTDLPGGSNEEMYKTLNHEFKTLDDSTLLYPGHDYHGNTMSVIGYEKRNNIFLAANSLEEFVGHVDKAFSKIEQGMSCSANIDIPESSDITSMQKAFVMAVMDYADKNPEEYSISVEGLNSIIHSGKEYIVVDVRDVDEFAYGHLENAVNISVGPNIQNVANKGNFPSGEHVYVMCGSGTRSTLATMYLKTRGLNVTNVTGGIKAWKQAGYEMVK